MEEDSVLTGRAVPKQVISWVDLEDVMLSVMSQTWTETVAICLVGSLELSDPQRQKQDGGRRGLGGHGRSVLNGDRVSIWEGEKALEMGGGDSCTPGNVPNAVECALERGQDGEFHAMCILSQLVSLKRGRKERKLMATGRGWGLIQRAERPLVRGRMSCSTWRTAGPLPLLCLWHSFGGSNMVRRGWRHEEGQSTGERSAFRPAFQA